MASKISMDNWMSELPEYLKDKPLINLCIPGSHDSFTWNLDRCGPIGRDQPSWLQFIAKWFPPVKFVIYNWSQCQKLSIHQQLEHGVRYLDIRLTCQRDRIRTIHGLCGQDLESLVDEVTEFLKTHPKEVLLLDFNHFYNMGWSDHQKTVRRLLTAFGSQCCPVPPFTELSSLNLNTCWRYGWRVIVFYQISFEAMEKLIACIPASEPPRNVHTPMPYLLWTYEYIKSPWANTNRLNVLFSFLECALDHKKQLLPCGGFFVTQGILTPQVKDVACRPLSNLRDRMGIPAVMAIIDWLSHRGQELKPKLNVIMTDFVETEDFCRKVIALNYS